VNKFEWLLFLHITGAFLFLGAAVVALVFNSAALLREKPSEIALLLRLTARTTPAFGIGGVLLIVFGLWLVDNQGYGYGDAWIVAALVLFVLSNIFGAVGGGRGKPTMELAERLAAEGDQPSAELKTGLRDPLVLFLDYGAAVLGFAVLVLMIWKPGAGG
jgi:uncharacterized membrane protein